MIPTVNNNIFNYNDDKILNIFTDYGYITLLYSSEGYYNEPNIYSSDTPSSSIIIQNNSIYSSETADVYAFYLTITGNVNLTLVNGSYSYINNTLNSENNISVNNNIITVITTSSISYSGNGSIAGYVINFYR